MFAVGPAGTGKTYVCVSHGVLKVRDGTYEKLVVTRPTIEVGRSLGFMPGGLRAKMHNWLIPIYDSIEAQIGKAEIEKWLNEGKLEIAPLQFVQGRTFNDAYVYMDEAQNTSPLEMKMFLTRIGENSQVVVGGDTTQRVEGGECGLSLALSLIRQGGISAEIVEFEEKDIVRSKMCQEWVTAFSHHERRNLRLVTDELVPARKTG